MQGLLQILKPVIEDVNLKRFNGQSCVIDISTWLYKGVFSTAYKTHQGIESLGHMGYPLKMLHMLLQYGIRPICIFDGRPHAGKIETEKKRSIDKAKNKELAEQHIKEGNED